MKIKKIEAKKLAKKYKINLDVVPLEEFHFGLNIELEHGSNFGKLTNITKNSKDLTTRIVIAHLLEYPDYYKRLKKMESSAERYWSTRTKKSIFE